MNEPKEPPWLGRKVKKSSELEKEVFIKEILVNLNYAFVWELGEKHFVWVRHQKIVFIASPFDLKEFGDWSSQRIIKVLIAVELLDHTKESFELVLLVDIVWKVIKLWDNLLELGEHIREDRNTCKEHEPTDKPLGASNWVDIPKADCWKGCQGVVHSHRSFINSVVTCEVYIFIFQKGVEMIIVFEFVWKVVATSLIFGVDITLLKEAIYLDKYDPVLSYKICDKQDYQHDSEEFHSIPYINFACYVVQVIICLIPLIFVHQS